MQNIFLKKMNSRILGIALCAVLALSGGQATFADTLSNAKNAKEKAERELNNANSQINELKAQENAIQAEIDAIDDELVILITNMNILAQEIADKTAELEQVTQDLADAEARQASQYADMKKRIRYMYEKGDSALYDAIIGSDNISDVLNRVEYVNDVYKYDRNLLDEYEKTVKEVAELKIAVETEKAEMEDMQSEYEAQEVSLNAMLETKKNEKWSTDSLLTAAKNKAAEYQATIEEQNRIIKEEERKAAEAAARKKAAEEAARKKAAEEAAKKSEAQSQTVPTDNESTTTETKPEKETPAPAASGSGGSVVNYACQFIGNPYVWGGTSLTSGADCSGFVMSVYSHFGVSLPHSSGAMQSCGTGVSYDQAAPGDLICYSGHVAIYMGGGRIVHAQNAATGITTSSATYRTIVAVRRVI